MAPLGEVAVIERHGVEPGSLDPSTPYIGLEHIERGGRIIGNQTVAGAAVKSTKFRFTSEHVLFGKLRPNLGKIAIPSTDGVCSTDILPILPGPHLDRRFLFHYLNQPHMVDFAASQATGANLPRLSPTALAKFEIPVPAVAEQRRVAAILDHADLLRSKRRQTLARLDDLAESIFLSTSGEYTVEKVPFESVVTGMRNGLSPSKAGTVTANVLTLSAVTQGPFDPSAIKAATFLAAPPPEQRVSADDFLICRGNGNLTLVGVGVHPERDHPALTFPDTVIAATIDRAKVDPIFLETAWRQPAVRRQIEAVARTTNGTYKVNQQTLGGVEISLPPLAEQRKFARRFKAIPNPGLSELDELFDSLQARAFSGQV